MEDEEDEEEEEEGEEEDVSGEEEVGGTISPESPLLNAYESVPLCASASDQSLAAQKPRVGK